MTITATVPGQQWRIRLEKVNLCGLGTDKQWEPFLSFRVVTPTQADAEKIAARYLTQWLHRNPGVPAIYVVGGLSGAERGE